jgi:hypothetical protein
VRGAELKHAAILGAPSCSPTVDRLGDSSWERLRPGLRRLRNGLVGDRRPNRVGRSALPCGDTDSGISASPARRDSISGHFGEGRPCLAGAHIRGRGEIRSGMTK